jgi:RNA-directed DNA polymerase
MPLSSGFLQRLDLSTAAASVVKTPLDHFPPLIGERCLAAAPDVLASYTHSVFSDDHHVVSEILTMPRRGFGPRPVQVLEPCARVLLTALVEHLGPFLQEPSRARGAWEEHRQYGLNGSEEYIVETDIASFYEYIEHDLLRKEVLLRSLDAQAAEALDSLLLNICGRARGLPQMLSISDVLADTYLSVLDRRLTRNGWKFHRYADDIRIAVEDWEAANTVIELVAEHVRTLGLILSSNKTRIYRRRTLVEYQEKEERFLRAHFEAARSALTRIVWVMNGPYAQQEVDEPESATAIRQASWDILAQWHEATNADDPAEEVPTEIRGFLNTALAAVASHDDRLPNALIQNLVFHEPPKIEQVCKYIVRRCVTYPREKHWGTIRSLMGMGRQSPWAKLWILATIENLPSKTGASVTAVLDWVRDQLKDRHELVRAQAAWVLACRRLLTPLEVQHLYTDASPLSQPAITAAAYKQGDVPQPILTALRQDGRLNREAAGWGSTQ